MAAGLVDLSLRLNGVLPSGRDNDQFYRREVMPLEYEAVLGGGRDDVSVGRSVTLDAPFVHYFNDTNYVTETLARLSLIEIETVVVQVEIDEVTLRRRIEKRDLRRDDWKLANWLDFWSRSTTQLCQWQGVTTVRVQNDDHVNVGDLCSKIIVM